MSELYGQAAVPPKLHPLLQLVLMLGQPAGAEPPALSLLPHLASGASVEMVPVQAYGQLLAVSAWCHQYMAPLSTPVYDQLLCGQGVVGSSCLPPSPGGRLPAGRQAA